MTGSPLASFAGSPLRERSACGVALIAQLGGKPSRGIVTDALEALRRMSHRAGEHEGTGDGSGVLLGLPHSFLARVLPSALGRPLPPAGAFGIGMVFLPAGSDQAARCRSALEDAIRDTGLELLGWREVPVDVQVPGAAAQRVRPRIEQVVVGAPGDVVEEAFERSLFLARRRGEAAVRRLGAEGEGFHVCSLSSRTMVFKGQLTPEQLGRFYLDLSDPTFESPVAMVHSRFSTNTFPSWSRAQPMRMLGHNGEINTLQGNVNWMRAREPLLRSAQLGGDLTPIFPAIDTSASDSGMLDNALELLVRAGRALPEALLALVPCAWENDPDLSPAQRAFHEAQASLVEPWDGPAALIFTDGRLAGGLLDRNGLRPARFWVTRDDRVILSSEVGVVDVAPADVVRKGRLGPGKMLLLDLEAGTILEDAEVKASVAADPRWAEWLERGRVRLGEVVERHRASSEPHAAGGAALPEEERIPILRAFGYTLEQVEQVLEPMAAHGKEAVGSMGTDLALACLSDRARLPADYFKQRFAQVTNPPIDSLREAIVTSLATVVGPQGNLLEPDEGALRRLWIDHPLLSTEEFEALVRTGVPGWSSHTLSLLYPAAAGGAGLSRALDRIRSEAEAAVERGARILVLSDRGVDREHLAASALLTVGAVHHHLIDCGLRGRVALIVDTGEPREVHHLCLLLGYGVDAIHPWLVLEVIRSETGRGAWGSDLTAATGWTRWRAAAGAGILKVMSKMGISTLASYRGAQIFEAVGMGEDVIARCFRGTVSRVGGVTLDILGEEALRRHRDAWPTRGAPVRTLDVPGEYAWRAGGEAHQWNPDTISHLQQAARRDSREAYQEFSRLCHEEEASRTTLRSLLAFAPQPHGAIPVEEVEPPAEIVKRFSTGAMSFGALSREAHETLAIGMNRMGGRSNSGEGGEDPERAFPGPEGDSRRSAIRQIASGRFGVTIEYLSYADQIQIKMAQGAKPGEGGQLPGNKVSEEIARVRGTTPGVMLISPPPHHDIYSIEDLAQLIFDLRNTNPEAEISVKLVSEAGVGTVAAGVAKAGADRILISGHDGGTGASPLTSLRHAGLPWELGVAEARETLEANGLRDGVVVETDGLMRTGRDVVTAALLGADAFGFSTAPLIALGCIMMRKCHLNTCPVGVCTQDPLLRKRFNGAPEHVINYLFLVAEEVREILAQLGLRTMEEAVGRTDLLRAFQPTWHWKASGVDLAGLLRGSDGGKPAEPTDAHLRLERRRAAVAARKATLDGVLDRELLRRASGALERARPVHIELPIGNTDRAVGTLLSHEVALRFGSGGLPDGTIHVKLEGSAGQTLGGWLAEGITLELEGDANDYVGKGLSGGRVIVYPHRDSPFVPAEAVIAGNVALYGATGGQAYLRGIAGERFAVRNSGALAVVEGVGDHGCEYMTGGRVVILGPTGRNFAAGMSGGIAYVHDPAGVFPDRCNRELVELGPVDSIEDQDELRWLLERHRRFTGSRTAVRILSGWEDEMQHFVKVIPTEYRLAMEALVGRRKAEVLAAREPHIHAPQRRRSGTTGGGALPTLPPSPLRGSSAGGPSHPGASRHG